jgi:hypothetical protein
VLEKGRILKEPDCVAEVVDLLFAQAGEEWLERMPNDQQLQSLQDVLVSGLELSVFPVSSKGERFCMKCAGLFLPTKRGDFDLVPSTFAHETGYFWIDRAVDFCLRKDKSEAKTSLKEVVKSVSGEYLGLQTADVDKGKEIIERSADVFGKPFSQSLEKLCKDYL